MMKKTLLILFSLAILKGFSQEHLMYLEAGGAGPMLSLNYEGFIDKSSLFNYRVGVGYAAGWDEFLTVPLGLTKFLEMKGNDYFEIGVVYTLGFNLYEDEFSGIFFGNIGFRFYNRKNTTFFRLSFNPAFDLTRSPSVFPWGGLSVGFRL